jgi:hypothetical protein
LAFVTAADVADSVTDAAAALAAYKAVPENVAVRYRATDVATDDLTKDPRVYAVVPDAVEFVWKVDPPMTLTKPAVLTGDAAEPTLGNKGLVAEPLNAK